MNDIPTALILTQETIKSLGPLAFFQFFGAKIKQEYSCTLSANDQGTTKNPAVDLELILMHHFSRILPRC